MSDHPLRVLVVDDERTIADSLAQIFRSEGFDSHAVYDGDSAVTEASTFVPNVVITDIVMPGLNGWEVALAYSRLLPACRLILFSGHAEILGLPDRAGDASFRYEVYTKPVHPKVFLGRLQIEQELLRASNL